MAGNGVTGIVENSKVALSNRKVMDHAHSKLSEDLERQIMEEQQKGKTVSYILVD